MLAMISTGNARQRHQVGGASHPDPTMDGQSKVSESTTKLSDENKASDDIDDLKKHTMVVDDDTEKSITCCHPETSLAMILLKLGACMAAGIVFGLAMEKSRVFEPETIRKQMVFKQWIMLKMFLAAMATGQLLLCVSSVLPATKARFKEALQEYYSTFDTKGILTTTVGTFILGAGMTISGACPGMVLPQVGSDTQNSIFTFIGALLGGLVYGLAAPIIIKYTKPKKPFEVRTVYDKFKISYIVLALPMCVLIFIAVILMELFIPWEDDLAPQNKNTNGSSMIFGLKSWPPSAAGALIGALQLVIMLAVGDTLGGSSSYMTLVSQWVVTPRLKSMFPYLSNFRCGIGSWWQVFYVLSAMLGGFLSALSSDSVGTTKGVPIAYAITGGFCMLFGARLASGCTSGHGLSGTALLFWLSLLAVPVMFAGGIITAFILQAAGVLDTYECGSLPC